MSPFWMKLTRELVENLIVHVIQYDCHLVCFSGSKEATDYIANFISLEPRDIKILHYLLLILLHNVPLF